MLPNEIWESHKLENEITLARISPIMQFHGLYYEDLKAQGQSDRGGERWPIVLYPYVIVDLHGEGKNKGNKQGDISYCTNPSALAY